MLKILWEHMYLHVTCSMNRGVLSILEMYTHDLEPLPFIIQQKFLSLIASKTSWPPSTCSMSTATSRVQTTIMFFLYHVPYYMGSWFSLLWIASRTSMAIHKLQRPLRWNPGLSHQSHPLLSSSSLFSGLLLVPQTCYTGFPVRTTSHTVLSAWNYLLMALTRLTFHLLNFSLNVTSSSKAQACLTWACSINSFPCIVCYHGSQFGPLLKMNSFSVYVCWLVRWCPTLEVLPGQGSALFIIISSAWPWALHTVQWPPTALSIRHRFQELQWMPKL